MIGASFSLASLASQHRPAVPPTTDGMMQSFAVAADGWAATIAFGGLAIGQSFVPSPEDQPRMTLSVLSPGYDETGAVVSVPRSVIATHALMRAYPDHSLPQEEAVGGQARIRTSLSDYVHAGDTIVAALAEAGAYGSSIAGSLSGSSIESSSTAGYPTVVADWAAPPRRRCGAAESLDVEVVAFHKFARNGKPVACVRVTGTPTSGAPVTRVASYRKSTLFGDSLPVYVATFSGADFAAGQDVRFDFEALPWVGDASAVRSTSGGTTHSITALGPQIHYWGDWLNGRIVFVDPASGDNATGIVATTLAAAKSAPFLTITGAVQALLVQASDLSGARCYLAAGAHGWLTASPTGSRSAPSDYFTIEGDPDLVDARGAVTVNLSGTVYPVLLTAGFGCLRNLSLAMSPGNYGLVSGAGTNWWLDNVAMSSTMTANTPYASATRFYVTRGTYTAPNASARTLSTSGTNNLYHLVRAVAHARSRIDTNCLLSTRIDGSVSGGQVIGLGNASNLRASNVIAHNVRVDDWVGNSTALLELPTSSGAIRDVAVVQCLLRAASGANQPMRAFGENLSADVDNVLMDYLTTTGGGAEALRLNIHNDPLDNPTTAATDQVVYTNFVLKRSAMSWVAVKDDLFHGANEGDTGAGLLTAGWSKRYGVGWHDVTSAYQPDNFPPAHFGLRSRRERTVVLDTGFRPVSGYLSIPAGAVHQGLTWDLDGTARRTDGQGAAAALERA